MSWRIIVIPALLTTACAFLQQKKRQRALVYPRPRKLFNRAPASDSAKPEPACLIRNVAFARSLSIKSRCRHLPDPPVIEGVV
jgi:hypothetical protein